MNIQNKTVDEITGIVYFVWYDTIFVAVVISPQKWSELFCFGLM